MRFLERFGARSGLLAASLLALTACQSPSADPTAMSSQQKEVYAYNEGAIPPSRVIYWRRWSSPRITLIPRMTTTMRP